MNKFNKIWKFRSALIPDMDFHDIFIYTKPFDKSYVYYVDEVKKIKEKFFTKEKIEELKEEYIKHIKECENPFYIWFVDTATEYDNITEDQLFKLEDENI